MQERTLKLVFLAFCSIAVLFPLLNVYYIFPAFESVAVELAESEAANLVRHMSLTVTRDGRLLPREELDPVIKDFVRDAHQVSGVKVYSAPAIVIYSYPPGSEGEVLKKTGFWRTLQSGKEYSKLKRRGMVSQEGLRLETDVLEVYIPIIHKGDFYGVFEVYYDLSEEVSQVKKTVYKVSAVMLVVAILAFVIVTFIVLRGSASEGEGIAIQMNIRSPSYHIFMVSVSIFVAELVIMIFLPVLPELSRLGDALVDSFILLFIVSPVMYLLIFRPLSWALHRLERSEAELKGLLEEKDEMLRNMVLRVHGNLYMISSMLSMHARKLEDTAAREAIQDSQGRISSMVLVYELMHRSIDLGGIRARDFFESLSVRIMRGLNVDANKVHLLIDVDDIQVDVDSTVACGLILNELLSNSLRHAFPGDRRGEVMVSLKKSANDEVAFSVSDNGVGLPEGFDFEKSRDLGLTIVRALSEQIGGNLQCDCHEGTKVAMAFKPETDSG